MNSKMTLFYTIRSRRNPQTGRTLSRPVAESPATLHTDGLVKFALESGYVRGQYCDMCGVLNGFLEAIADQIARGNKVVLDGWFQSEGRLTGTVAETGRLGHNNTYQVALTPLGGFSHDISDFNWKKKPAVEVVPNTAV